MALYPVTGSRFFVEASRGSAITVSDVSNANPAVCTAASHGLVDNDEFLFSSSGWEDLNASVFRVNQLTSSTFDLKVFDATNTEFYAAGSGGGTGYKIATWQEIGQVVGVQSSGGGAQNITVQLINKRKQQRITTGFEASSLSFEVAFDPALADQIALQSASQSLAKKAFKFVLPGSAYAYCYGAVSMSPVPTFDTGSVMRRTINVDIDGLFVFHSS